MANRDISRPATGRRQHYAGSRLQQGRPVLDVDFNDAAEASDEDLRQAVLAIAGHAASADEGFLPDLKVGDVLVPQLVRFGAFFQAFILDWKLKAGTLFVGGQRFEQMSVEPVVFQRGYLQMGPGTAPRAAAGAYRHFAMLRGWEQAATSTEDPELREPALGGADTTVRLARRRRIEVYSVEAETCADALAEVLDETVAAGAATYDEASSELRSNARLELGFVAGDFDDCAACAPRLRGRYLGPEPHTLRLMLATSDRFVWALDTSPLYRVKLILEGNGVARIEMLNPPKDDTLQPRDNHVVEFLPPGALLVDDTGSNAAISDDTTASATLASPVGFFGEVIAAYDPAKRCMQVQLSAESLLQIGLIEGKLAGNPKSKAKAGLKADKPPIDDVIALRWDVKHPHAAALNPSSEGEDGFSATLFMRVWNRKSDSDPVTLPITSTGTLGSTGIVPNFSGPGLPGDTWLAKVSPDEPDTILPLELQVPGGAPPHGPRRVLAPLALVGWQSNLGVFHTVTSIETCRPNLPSIADRGCCTLWVGIGLDGDLDRIQAAIDRLPREGGRICILPGTYTEELRVADRRNVTLQGCGAETIIRSPEGINQTGLLEIDATGDSGRIVVRDLALDALGQIGVAVEGTGCRLSNLDIRTSPSDIVPTQSAVRLLAAGDIVIRGCRLGQDGGLSPHSALYLESAAPGVLVEDNDVRVPRGEGGPLSWGGIHVGDGSFDVEIRANRIDGGLGHGITLGSVAFRATDGSERLWLGAGTGQTAAQPQPTATGIIEPVILDPDDPQGLRYHPEPQAALSDILIAENRISGMGGSGIASLAVEVSHDEEARAAPLCMRQTTFPVDHLSIVDNEVTDNVQRAPPAIALPHVLGGIVLSLGRDVRLQGNHVHANARDLQTAHCGIFAAAGDDFAIADNRIEANGSRGDPNVDTPAMHGGIILAPPRRANVTGPQVDVVLPESVHISSNVVDQPGGPALLVLTAGPTNISNNRLASESYRSNPLIGDGLAVVVVNVGQPYEAVDLPPGEPSDDRWRQPQGSNVFLTGRAQELRPGNGATVVFHANDIMAFGIASDQPTREQQRIAVLVASTDAVLATANSYAAPGAGQALRVNAVFAGSTAIVANNHGSEHVNATLHSLGVVAPYLLACADNLQTHCHQVFAGPNSTSPDFVVDSGNLSLLAPANGGCRSVAGAIQALLDGLATGLFRSGRQPVEPVRGGGVTIRDDLLATNDLTLRDVNLGRPTVRGGTIRRGGTIVRGDQ